VTGISIKLVQAPVETTLTEVVPSGTVTDIPVEIAPDVAVPTGNE
jgi:hypothetical protein